MIFINNPPCEEAKYESIFCEETRGTRHWEYMKNVWIVEFNTLDELNEFCNKYGIVVIKNYSLNNAYKEIEICDAYEG